MRTFEHSIKIFRRAEKLAAIEVNMPIKTERSFDDYLKVHLPLFDIHTWAKDESGIEKSVETTIKLFYLASEEWGEGMVRELQALGWKIINDKPAEQVLVYNNQVFRTDPNHFIKRLQLI